MFSGDTTGLAKSATKAQGIVGSTVSSIGKLGSGIFSGLASGVAGMPGMISGALSSVNSLNTAFVQLGIDGIKTAVGTLAQFASEGFHFVDELNDAATQIGTTATKLSELQYIVKLTGGQTESLNGALQKMGKFLNTTEANDFAKQLGLDINDLRASDPADTFMKIRDSWDSMATAGSQTAQMMEVFGKSGVDLANTLRADSKQVEQIKKDFNDFGLALKDTDVTAIGDVNDQFDRVGALMKSLKQSIAAEFAPVVSAVIKEFIEVAKQIGDVRSVLQKFINYAAFGLDVVVNVVNGMIGVFGKVSKVILKAAAAQYKLYEGNLRLLGLTPLVGDYFNALADGAKITSNALTSAANIADQQADAALARFEKGSNIQGWLNDVQRNAAQAGSEIKKVLDPQDVAKGRLVDELTKLNEKLELEIKVHGLEGAEKQIAELAHAADFRGESFEITKKFRELTRQLEELDLQKKQMEEFRQIGERAFTETQTPVEKLISEMNRLRDAFGAGAVANDDFRKMQEKLKKDFLSSLSVEVETPLEKFKKDMKELDKAFSDKLISEKERKIGKGQLSEKLLSGRSQFANSADVGTQASRDAILRQLFGDGAKGVDEKILDVQRESVTELRHIAKILAEVKPEKTEMIRF